MSAFGLAGGREGGMGTDNGGGCLTFPLSSSITFGQGNESQTVTSWSNRHLKKLLTLGDKSKNREISGDGSTGQVHEVAAALNQLSFPEREQIYHDIHGTAGHDKEKEDPSMVKEHIDKLVKGLEMYETSATQDSTLKFVMDQNPTYLQQESLLTAFLRAEEWNPTQAVSRLEAFFEQKRELFGIEKVAKDITLADMDDDDLECLKSGCLQHVPLQDQSGRQILINIPSLEKYRTKENLLRTFFYMLMHVSKDAQAQQRGLVEIVYKVGSQTMDLTLRMMIARLRTVMPIRTAAAHSCMTTSTADPTISFFFNLIRPFVNSRLISRFKFHTGGHVEIQYELLSFGIPLSALPVDSQGRCNATYQKIWLRQRREIEQGTSTSIDSLSPMEADSSNNLEPRAVPMQEDEETLGSQPPLPTSPKSAAFSSRSPSPQLSISSSLSATILQPLPNDCILGRGKPIDQYVGNVQFRHYIQQHPLVKEYALATKKEKRQLVEQMRKELQQDRDVRFLKEHESGRGWLLADDVAIREKISRTIRRVFPSNETKRQHQQKKQDLVGL